MGFVKGKFTLLFSKKFCLTKFVCKLFGCFTAIRKLELDAYYNFLQEDPVRWNLEVDRSKTQGKITSSHDGQTFTIRVLKIRLSSGETEALLTNLNQKQLPIRNAGELYFKRWWIETAYDTLKSKL